MIATREGPISQVEEQFHVGEHHFTSQREQHRIQKHFKSNGLGISYLKYVYPHLHQEKLENHFVKTTLNTPNRDLNLDLSVIGSLVYCESSVLDHAATKAVSRVGKPMGLGRLYSEERYSHMWGWKVENHSRKTTLSTLDRDSNLDLTVIGSLVQYEISALDHAATEADECVKKRNTKNLKNKRACMAQCMNEAKGVCKDGEVWRTLLRMESFLPPPTEKQRWLFSLFIGTSALYASRTSMPLVIPAITKELNLSKTDSGTILSSFFWGYTLTQVFGGYLSDRIGGHKVIIAAAIGWSLVTFWMPIIITFLPKESMGVSFIVCVRILHGTFQGVHFPSMSSLTSQNLIESERASFFSILMSGSAFGTLVTGTLGSFVLDYFGWQAVFYTIGFLCIAWTLFLRYYVVAKDIRRAAIVTVPSKLHSSFLTKEETPVPSCVFGHACQNNCFFLLMSWLPTYFHDTFPNAKGWIVNMVPWLFSIPSTFLGKWLSEYLIRVGYSVTSTRKIIEVICLGSQALALIAIGLVTEYQWALVCVSVAIAATGFHNCGITVNPQDLAPKHSGSVFGLMNTIGAVPGRRLLMFSRTRLHAVGGDCVNSSQYSYKQQQQRVVDIRDDFPTLLSARENCSLYWLV
uniref:Major facilitator superfamily (MFS) profile domain-containing protein n=1 Tax=Timema genevievae TaxID=629358 RepID=A0A7R9JMX2_TIMGE|nr:unnamed protein product [Timema genevievae]